MFLNLPGDALKIFVFFPLEIYLELSGEYIFLSLLVASAINAGVTRKISIFIL